MNAHQAYRSTQAQTAKPGELVVMLYRGATRFIAAGIEGIEARDISAAHTNLVKAQAIITELHGSLDIERGGDIARNLGSLYEFMNRRLCEANVRKDAAPAREVEKLMRDLLPAWEAIVAQSATVPQAASRVLVAA